tara:strand:+ start:130 stop:435 length:306 start_codon:yes stop_codon:yes gene_type:complete
MKTIDELTGLIELWGAQKGILPDPDAMKQGLKTLEEVTELLSAIEDGDEYEVADAIGDIYVTLVMQTYAWGLTIEDCVAQAYHTINQRTGTMVNGVFIKDV